MQESLCRSPDWTIDSDIDCANNISRYDPLPRSSYIKLPKELSLPRKGLIFKV